MALPPNLRVGGPNATACLCSNPFTRLGDRCALGDQIDSSDKSGATEFHLHHFVGGPAEERTQAWFQEGLDRTRLFYEDRGGAPGGRRDEEDFDRQPTIKVDGANEE
jgi:hypothetical protein